MSNYHIHIKAHVMMKCCKKEKPVFNDLSFNLREFPFRPYLECIDFETWTLGWYKRLHANLMSIVVVFVAASIIT